jgi:hypothetical protein
LTNVKPITAQEKFNLPRANAILARAQALLWERDWCRPRLSAAHESENIKERRSRKSAVYFQKDMVYLIKAPSDGIGQEQLHYILIFKQPQKFIAPVFLERF